MKQLPAGANPDGKCILPTINPYSKKQRKRGLSWKENGDFSGICKLSNYQILECYEYLDKDVIKEEFIMRCRDCPYAFNSSRFIARHESNTNPYFIDLIVENETENPKCFVYFITDGEYVKIGVAQNVKSRLREIQTGNPKPLKVLYTHGVSDEKKAFYLESKLHAEYRDFRKTGEWFRIYDYLNVNNFSESSCFHDENGDLK